MVKGSRQFENRAIYFIVADNMKISPDEIFVDLTENGCPGILNYYQISNYGRVYNKFTNSFLVPQMGTDGYYSLELSTVNGPKRFRLNRLVMMAFEPISNPEQKVVNHKDCNPLNNCRYNLEWTTRTGNAIHAYDNGLMKYGEDGPTAIISKETAIEIAKLLETNMTFKEIADKVGNGATIGIVQNIYHGHGWVRDLKDMGFHFRPMKEKKPPSFRFSKETVHDLCRYFVSSPKSYGQNTKEYCIQSIEDVLKIDKNDITKGLIDGVRHIYERRNHKDVSSQYNF